ncbi:DUF6807 domain-containing protein [Cellulomonas timonensis]|uniref:DUF6807 domain-containing protein n=1 Tax=Cellulomonas timonensis TaxID=1689271 RepID=UPI00082CCCBA|nr:PmoA family protein [Cellulomonas timonensis]
MSTSPVVKAPPWEPRPHWGPSTPLAELTLDGTTVAVCTDGAGAPGFDSPRPHLHPVRTLAGVVVTAAAPADHTWHVGLGLGVQDVDGHNLWGGRTYLPGAGYTWRRDHGRIRHDGWAEQAPDALTQHLTWLSADAEPLLTETRELRWARASGQAWRLDLATTLVAARPVRLGSPGAHGRGGGGYGGLFWRLPACEDVDVRTPSARGEDLVHGSVPADGARWLAWSARAASPTPPAGTPGTGEFTVAITPSDESTARDPWFVRVSGYPGIGSALAWQRAVTVRPGAGLRRSFRCLVADGRTPDAEVGRLLAAPVLSSPATPETGP